MSKKKAASTRKKSTGTRAEKGAGKSGKVRNSRSRVSSPIQSSAKAAPKPRTAEFPFTSTAEIPVPKKIIDEVIGQEEAVEVVRKASLQRRHVLLIGEPGTGKSMLGLAMAELLPKEKLVDVMSFANPNDENEPLIRTAKAGEARQVAQKARLQGTPMRNQGLLMLVIAILAMLIPWWVFNEYTRDYSATVGAIMFVAFFIGGIAFLALAVLFINLNKKMGTKTSAPKVIVDNFGNKQAPFFDATGAHAGALLGDVLHDPFQSGGLGTPAHERVVAGMIHKAHLGVLFIDEIATLQPHTQQELLTALQEGRYSITGQSERSAGAMVRTEPVPCRFVLIAAGNLETIKHMHPALRSRIRGYGYEVYMKETMPDNADNRKKIARFIAQEVRKDQKIPHFSRAAVEYILEEARRRANRKGHLTLRLRELGGIVRAAGDVALAEKAALVETKHIMKALTVARSLEQQIADQFIERKKEYEVIVTHGKEVGRVNGLAVIGGGGTYSGIILPIEAQVTPGGKQSEIIATGQLGDIAKEAVKNVGAIIKRYFGKDIKEKYDLYVQFLQTYEGVEGDSASIAVATSIISAFHDVPVRQDYAVTGSLSVRGEVLPVGGVGAKVGAAIDAGIKHVIVPRTNVKDIIIDTDKLQQITIIPVDHIAEVLAVMVDWKGKEKILQQIKRAK